MVRRLLFVLVLLAVVLVVVADRVGAAVAAHVLAGKVQTDEHLADRPDATIGGFPFLTQALHGRYDDVSITARGLTATGGVPITRLTAHLHGVHVGTGDVLHDRVTAVPVDRVDGDVFISYADLDRYLEREHLKVSAGTGGQLRVTGSVSFAGQSLSVSGAGALSVSDNVVHVTVRRVSAAAGTLLGSAEVSVGQHISFPVPLAGLPFRISLAHVRAGGQGVDATGTVRGLVLGGSR